VLNNVCRKQLTTFSVASVAELCCVCITEPDWRKGDVGLVVTEVHTDIPGETRPGGGERGREGRGERGRGKEEREGNQDGAAHLPEFSKRTGSKTGGAGGALP
jgi:hypothetical protein